MTWYCSCRVGNNDHADTEPRCSVCLEKPEEPFRFLNGDDYLHLCDVCRATISAVCASMFDGEQPDTDDPEAPSMYVYDNRMYCGGHECINKPKETIK